MPDNNYKPIVNLANILDDAIIDQVLAIDTNWTIIAWNKATEMKSGIKKQDALNHHLILYKLG